MSRALHRTLALLLGGLLLSSSASAQEGQAPERPAPSPELQTEPEGRYLQLQKAWPGAGTDDDIPYVDRRGELDPMAGTAILWPTAHTPEAGTFSYTNFFLIGNTVTYSFTDDQQLGFTAVLPSLGALHAQATYRIRLDEGPNHILTAIPVVHYQSEGSSERTTSSAVSAGGGLVADFYLSDSFVIGIGSHFQGTIAASTGSVVETECPDRNAFLRGECDRFSREWSSFPAGGHWFSLVGHAVYYVNEWMNLRGEIFTGGVFGTFLGTEYLYGRERLDARSRRYDDGEFAIGIPYDSSVTAGIGTGLTFDSFAVQASGYVYYWDEQFRLTPMFSGTVAF